LSALTNENRTYVASLTAALETNAEQMREAAGAGCTAVDLQRWARNAAAAARLLAILGDHTEAVSKSTADFIKKARAG
jgi:hypothetical protein